MKRLIGVVATLFVLSVVAAPFVQAADGEKGGEWGARNERPRKVGEGDRPRDRGLDIGEDARAMHPPAPLAIARLLIRAVTAPWAKDDAELQALVDKAVRDRKDLYKAEGDQMKAFEAVLRGFRNGKTREELEAEIEALKTAHEQLREAAQALHADIRAIHERMKELRPERPHGDGAADVRPEALRDRERRGPAKRPTEDTPPDIF